MNSKRSRIANAELPGGAKRRVDGWWKPDGTKLAAAPANLAAVTVPKDRANGSNFREFVTRAHVVNGAEMRRHFPGEFWLPPSPGQWLQTMQHDLNSETGELIIDTQLATTFEEAERIVTRLKAGGWKWPTIKVTPLKNTVGTESQPTGLEFLKPYPKLHGLSLDMTEPQFLEIVKRQELKTTKTVDVSKESGEKVTHHIALGDGHTLIVMFDKDAKCSGIQRVRG